MCDLSVITCDVDGLKSGLVDNHFFFATFHILFCSETWQCVNDEFCIERYKIISVPRPVYLKIERF